MSISLPLCRAITLNGATESFAKPTDRQGTGRVVQAAKEQARVYLRKQQPFVWNATNITRNMRAQLIDLFVTYRARVTIVYVEVPNPLRAG